MKRILLLLLALAVCITGPGTYVSGEWNVYASSAENAGENNTENTSQSETEPVPVLLDTDKVSTDEILLYSSSCVVMDVDTGAILYSKNKLDRRYPASTTKIMTTLLALERCDLEENVTFSENAVYSITWDSSNMALEPGNSLTMEEALYGIMLRSANEAANGVAEYVSGSMEAFARDMTEYAIELGCRRTNFTNPSGLHDDNHYTTAKDLAIISSAAIKNETFREITGTIFYTVENVNYKVKEPEEETDENGSAVSETTETDEPQPEPVQLYNHHKMVNNEYPYEGCIGGKTGYTGEARNTLVTYAERDGHLLVCVLLDCPGGGNYIYMDAETSLNYCFENYEQLAQAYADAQAELDYTPLTIVDWYHTEAPLPLEDMLYPYVKQAFSVYVPYVQNRKAQEALDNAISEKSVKDFIEYSRFHNYRPLIIAGIVLTVVCIVLVIVGVWMIKLVRRKRRRMRYKKLKKRRLQEDAQQTVARAVQKPESEKASETELP